MIKYWKYQRDVRIVRRVFFSVFILLCTCTLALRITAREVPSVEIDVNAKSAIIMEAGSGKVLFEKDADERLQPASTVKVMTAVVAMENLPLESEIIPTSSIVEVEPTVIELRPGIRYRLKDLISAILIKSANDAAVAIAEAVAGSEEDFAELMNQKAVEIGLRDTNYTNASGLPAENREDQYTTARDLVTLMQYARRYKFLIETLSKKETDIYGSDNKRIHLAAHNKSLFFKEGAAWGKTGYTIKAGRTFVGMNPSYRPKVIFALLKSKKLWHDISVLKNRGLEIYRERHRNIFVSIISWIRG